MIVRHILPIYSTNSYIWPAYALVWILHWNITFQYKVTLLLPFRKRTVWPFFKVCCLVFIVSCSSSHSYFCRNFPVNQPVKSVMERKFSSVCELAMALQLKKMIWSCISLSSLMIAFFYVVWWALSHSHKVCYLLLPGCYTYSCVSESPLRACPCFDIYKGNVAAQHRSWMMMRLQKCS